MMIPGGLNERGLQELRELPKVIQGRMPRYSFREEDGHKRGELDLLSISDPRIQFQVFIRQNTRYIENFSIGLQYPTSHRIPGTITLVRYNGSHGEEAMSSDGHFARPHIHYLTAQELAEGHLQPRERRRELTDRYGTFEHAIAVFLQDIGVSNANAYFPELAQLRLFDGC